MTDDFLARDLYAAWINLLTSLGADSAATTTAFNDLVARYTEPHRIYHNLQHVRHVLGLVQEYGDPSTDRATVELAVWFHDVIYDPHASDNEERSADHAEQEVGRLGVQGAESLRPLILATKTHVCPPGDMDCKLLIDADLAILGSPPEEYDRYAVAIGMEYAWVPEADYSRGRGEALRGFLQRERIYSLPAFHDRFEGQARRNLARELAGLKD
jgi:predicted metal-dependent HD superfamily phosphohydrolase